MILFWAVSSGFFERRVIQGERRPKIDGGDPPAYYWAGALRLTSSRKLSTNTNNIAHSLLYQGATENRSASQRNVKAVERHRGN